MTRPSIALLLAASVLLTSPVRAQTTAEQRAAADALYEEAGTLIKASRFAEACPKLETSERLDPGTGTLLRLGYCYEQIGKTASAWSAYNEAEGMARKAGDKRADDAAARARALEPKLVRLLVSVQSPVVGLEIRRDGKPIDSGLWGTAIPVDPGELVVEASAPGKKTWKGTARIDPTPGSTMTFSVPMLADAPTGTAPVALPSPFWSGQRIAGGALGGVGIGSLVVSSIFTAKMRAKNQDSLVECLPNDPTKCSAAGVALRNQAYDLSKVATGALLAGGVAAAAGLIVFLTAPRRAAPKTVGNVSLTVMPVAGPGTGGLSLQGTW